VFESYRVFRQILTSDGSVNLLSAIHVQTVEEVEKYFHKLQQVQPLFQLPLSLPGYVPSLPAVVTVAPAWKLVFFRQNDVQESYPLSFRSLYFNPEMGALLALRLAGCEASSAFVLVESDVRYTGNWVKFVETAVDRMRNASADVGHSTLFGATVYDSDSWGWGKSMTFLDSKTSKLYYGARMVVVVTNRML
jgi:hypothetical protein